MAVMCVVAGLVVGVSALSAMGVPPHAHARNLLKLHFDGLEPLGEGFVYEGWLIVDGMPISTGRFEVMDNGEVAPPVFPIDRGDAAAATAFVLTIEPAEDDPPEPSATHVLAGDLIERTAHLTIGHPAALGTDFTSASGDFILATPSTADIAEDYDQGIWWVDPGAGPGPSLDLPMLPAGWMFEGWVVGPDGPISTGRFLSVVGADSDGAGPTSGPDMGPPFPGQDFIDPPLVLIGLPTVISVEPDPDDSPAPFAIKPLVDPEIEDVGAGVLQMMINTPENAPTGMAWILGPKLMTMMDQGSSDVSRAMP
jgi:hypothetical protein